MNMLRDVVKKLLPGSPTETYRRRKRNQMDRRNAVRSTEEVFGRIYRDGEWGGTTTQPSSGSGSTDSSIVGPYVDRVDALFETLHLRGKRIVDLGCGDFRVGQRLTHLSDSYVGVDVVDDLIASHRENYGTESVGFLRANVVTDPLPEGDVCFVRQVFQHLSNGQVAAILPKLEAYRYVIVTEHYPRRRQLARPNIDMVQGSRIRLYDGSGVYLDRSPFGIASNRLLPVLESVSGGFESLPDPGIIRTYLLVHPTEAETIRHQLDTAGLLLRQLA